MTTIVYEKVMCAFATLEEAAAECARLLGKSEIVAVNITAKNCGPSRSNVAYVVLPKSQHCPCCGGPA